MAPQDDLTAERAARLYRDLMSIIHSDPHPIDQPCGRCLAAIAGHDRETRQEALREYREAIAHKLQLDHCHRTNMVSNKQIIAALGGGVLVCCLDQF